MKSKDKIKESQEMKPLFYYTSQNNLTMLLDFIHKAGVQNCRQAVEQSQKSALHIACRDAGKRVVQSLLQMGWNINQRDRHLSTPLHIACQGQKYQNVIAILSSNIKQSCDIKAQDCFGRTALHISVCGSSLQIINVLIENCQELILMKDTKEKTALHYSLYSQEQNQAEVIKLLLTKGVDINAIDIDHQTALHYAVIQSKYNVVQLLIEANAQTNIRDTRGKFAAEYSKDLNIKKQLTPQAINQQLAIQSSFEKKTQKNLNSPKLEKKSQKQQFSNISSLSSYQKELKGYQQKKIKVPEKTQQYRAYFSQYDQQDMCKNKSARVTPNRKQKQQQYNFNNQSQRNSNIQPNMQSENYGEKHRRSASQQLPFSQTSELIKSEQKQEIQQQPLSQLSSEENQQSILNARQNIDELVNEKILNTNQIVQHLNDEVQQPSQQNYIQPISKSELTRTEQKLSQSFAEINLNNQRSQEEQLEDQSFVEHKQKLFQQLRKASKT